jgi:hypothetical protein
MSTCVAVSLLAVLNVSDIEKIPGVHDMAFFKHVPLNVNAVFSIVWALLI